MSRIVNLGAAQMGPIAPDETRESCVKRLIDMIKQASSRGCQFVVFPELALTTFFPRYYEENITKMDHWYQFTQVIKCIQISHDFNAFF